MNRTITVASTLLGLLAATSTTGCRQPDPFDAPHVDDQLIVGWIEPIPAPGRAPTSPDTMRLFATAVDLLARLDLQPNTFLLDGRAWLVESTSALDDDALAEKAARLQALDLVRYAVPNHLVFFAQTDPTCPAIDHSGAQQNLEQIDAAGAWAITPGSPETVVAIIDTGADVDHEDLKGALWTNPCELPNGIDDPCPGTSAGNGLDDDLHGWNFASDDADLKDAGPHGTHVAGIVAATRSNGRGIAGVADVRLAILRTSKGTVSDVAKIDQALQYAIDQGFRIANASFTTHYNDALEDGMILAGEAGMIVVAAAGNASKDLDFDNTYPASFDLDHVISVAAVDALDDPCCDTNHGSTVVELAAPGKDVLSTYPKGETVACDQYVPKSGSSMAAPHVAGVIALILSVRPDATVDEVRHCLAQGETAMEDETVWGVRLDARRAVEACASMVEPVEEPPSRVTDPAPAGDV